jgi:hypothetical protein
MKIKSNYRDYYDHVAHIYGGEYPTRERQSDRPRKITGHGFDLKQSFRNRK